MQSRPLSYVVQRLERTYIILVGITSFAAELRGKRGFEFVDNAAALLSLVRGRSNNHSVDRMALQIHAALFSLECWLYFEWIACEANWSDGISRHG